MKAIITQYKTAYKVLFLTASGQRQLFGITEQLNPPPTGFRLQHQVDAGGAIFALVDRELLGAVMGLWGRSWAYAFRDCGRGKGTAHQQRATRTSPVSPRVDYLRVVAHQMSL
jgi:hypothetical protein